MKNKSQSSHLPKASPSGRLEGLFYLILLAFIPVWLSAQTIYVDAGNNSGVEDGSEAHPFNTVEEGLDAGTSGQTVFIQNGEYSPSGGILYLKPGVALKGESKENSIINGNIKDTATSDLPVKIENLKFNQFIFERPLIIHGNITEASYIKNCIGNSIQIFNEGGYSDESKTELGPIPYFHITGNNISQAIGFAFGVGVIVGGNLISGNNAGTIALAHGSTKLTESIPLPDYSYLIENNIVTESIVFGQGDGKNIKIIVHENTAKSVEISSKGGYTYSITGNTLQDGFFDSSGANRTTFSGNTIMNGKIIDKSDGFDNGEEDEIFENNTINYELSEEDNNPVIVDIRSTSITLKNNTINGTGRLTGIMLLSATPTNIIDNIINLDIDSLLPRNSWEATCGIRNGAGEGVVTGNKIHGAYYGYYSGSGASLFANNEIDHAHHGFMSAGNEEVANNTIKNCTGHGMILAGVKGPVHDNIIINNDSAGIYMMYNLNPENRNIERNIIKNNGWYDFVNASNPEQRDTIFARNNAWDHQTLGDILQYDILNLYPDNVTVEADSFIIPPDVPQLSLPENAVAETDTSLNLSWQAATGAEFYKLQLSETPEFNTLFLEQDSILSLNFMADSLKFNTTYYWRCQSVNLAGESDWSETWQFKTKIATGINEMQLPALLKVYPNPVSGKLYIELPTATTTFNLKIIDIHGRVVHSHESFSGKSIDVSGLPAGVYCISLQTKKERHHAWFVKR